MTRPVWEYERDLDIALDHIGSYPADVRYRAVAACEAAGADPYTTFPLFKRLTYAYSYEELTLAEVSTIKRWQLVVFRRIVERGARR